MVLSGAEAFDAIASGVHGDLFSLPFQRPVICLQYTLSIKAKQCSNESMHFDEKQI